MKKEEEELRLVEFLLQDEDDIVTTVSLVVNPAIQKSFQLFKDVTIFDKQEFKTAEGEDKMEITGPAMVPLRKMLRYNEETKEYFNCFFSEKTVRESASLYLKSGNHTSANFDHNPDNFSESLFVMESWIVEDPELDKSKALGFEDVTKGTWFITYKVLDKALWKQIKQSDFSGFSIEGFFTHFEKVISEQELVASIEQLLTADLTDEEKETEIRKILFSNTK